MKDNKIKNVFDFVKAIAENKQPWSSYTEEEQKVWNNYMIIKCFSMNPAYIDVCNILSGYWNWEPERLYKCLCNLIPQGKYYFKYIKSSTPKPNSELLEFMAKYFNASKREMKDYVKILGQKDQIEILEKMGVDKSEIKKMIKK